MKPTKDRNSASIFLEYNGEGILFDCGEGTQRQMRLANLKPSKISKILIQGKTVLKHWLLIVPLEVRRLLMMERVLY